MSLATRAPNDSAILVEPYLEPYRETDYVRAFVRHRHLVPALRKWYVRTLLDSALAFHRKPIRVLDVGAGTGQFALEFLHSADGLSVEVTALEPSPAFRDYLDRTRLSAACHVLSDPLDAFEPESPFHIVLMSEVAHLFHNHREVFAGLWDIVTPAGVVALRYATREQAIRRNWYRFFPQARDVDVTRAPRANEYEKMLARSGFECATEEIDESVELDVKSRFEMVADRAYSSFRLVEDGAFQDGLRQLAHAMDSVSLRWENRMTWTTARRLTPA